MKKPNSRDFDQMSLTAQRIAQRMEELGTNASAVSMQAGLGRSSVRDILSGKAQNPRIDTLLKLTVPLQCSIEYLMNESIEPGSAPTVPPKALAGLDPTWVAGVAHMVELGVFRTPKIGSDGMELTHARILTKPRTVAYNPLQHDGWGLFQMNDDTLTRLGILKGDYLTAAEPFTEIAPLKPGTIVIVKRWIGNSPAEELSARVVTVEGGHVALAIASETEVEPPIILKDPPLKSEEQEKYLYNVYFLDDGKIAIEGVVFCVTRDL
jgi:Helix-turn-helix